MIKTNSKKFKEKIKNYLFNDLFDDLDYGMMEFKKESYKNEKEKAILILEIFCKETLHHDLTFEVFKNWASGLPAIIKTSDYYYSNSAIEILGDFLEETEEERSKYSEIEAENLLTHAIFKELESELKKC